jgi:hypothetical protein
MRNSDTYRFSRRNDWANYRRLYRGVSGALSSWPLFNPRQREWFIGSSQGSTVTKRRRQRSKYMPHESVRRGGSGPVFA